MINKIAAIEFNFTNNLRINLDHYFDDYKDEYHQCLTSDIFLIESNDQSDDEKKTIIGFIEIWLLQGNRAINNRLNIVDICDSIGQEVYEYADSIYKNGDLNRTIDDFGFSSDVLILHRIEIKKEYRGNNFGLIITQKVIEYLGSSCGAVLVKPHPLQFSDISELPGWQEIYDTRSFETDQIKATKKLQNYWSKLGFRSTKKHRVYYLSMAKELKKINLTTAST